LICRAFSRGLSFADVGDFAERQRFPITMGETHHKGVYSPRIAEVTDPGKPTEHELPVGTDRRLL
jgi:hypothetical protein